MKKSNYIFLLFSLLSAFSCNGTKDPGIELIKTVYNTYFSEWSGDDFRPYFTKDFWQECHGRADLGYITDDPIKENDISLECLFGGADDRPIFSPTSGDLIEIFKEKKNDFYTIKIIYNIDSERAQIYGDSYIIELGALLEKGPDGQLLISDVSWVSDIQKNLQNKNK